MQRSDMAWWSWWVQGQGRRRGREEGIEYGMAIEIPYANGNGTKAKCPSGVEGLMDGMDGV